MAIYLRNNGQWKKVSQDTSDATATAADILSDKTAYIASGKVTGTMQKYAGHTIVTPTTSKQTLQTANRFLTDDITINGSTIGDEYPTFEIRNASYTVKATANGLTSSIDLRNYSEDLVAEKIKKNAVIFGVIGAYEGNTNSGSSLTAPGQQAVYTILNDTSYNMRLVYMDAGTPVSIINLSLLPQETKTFSSYINARIVIYASDENAENRPGAGTSVLKIKSYNGQYYHDYSRVYVTYILTSDTNLTLAFGAR